ncbi:hypothetical protein DVH05_004318 [Phytophthora capsici]|nr:hypothetical protein DVH05_004318 [Phytophthora capsici]
MFAYGALNIANGHGASVCASEFKRVCASDGLGVVPPSLDEIPLSPQTTQRDALGRRVFAPAWTPLEKLATSLLHLRGRHPRTQEKRWAECQDHTRGPCVRRAVLERTPARFVSETSRRSTGVFDSEIGGGRRSMA